MNGNEAKQEPVDSNEKAGAYMEARLWEFIDMAASWPKAKPDSRIWGHVMVYAPAPEAKQEPGAQGEPCGWFDPQTGDYSRVNRLGWSALYLHPAPVNQQLLERISELEALNERLWVALKGYHSNSAKQDWPNDIWIAAEVALREAAIAAAEVRRD